jgi:hypothetical protein
LIHPEKRRRFHPKNKRKKRLEMKIPKGTAGDFFFKKKK